MNYRVSSMVILTITLIATGATQDDLKSGFPNESDRISRNTDVTSELSTLFDDFWEWLLKTHPTTATYIGIHKYDNKLEDHSIMAIRDKLVKVRTFYNRATRLRPELNDPADISNIDELIYVTSTYIEGYPYKGFLKSIDNIVGYHDFFIKILDRMPNKTQSDIDAMLSRMEDLPSRIDQTIDLLQLGMDVGITNHNYSMNKINKALQKYKVNNSEDSPLYKFFTTSVLPSESNKEKIQMSAKLFINDITGVFTKLGEFIEKEYITRPHISISTLKFGPKLYDECIRFYAPGMTAQEIHDIGLKESERIMDDMKKVIEELGYGQISVKEFSDMIKKDGDNYYQTAEDLVKGCQSLIDDRIQPKLINYFNTFPKAKVIVKGDKNPSISAYYQQGSQDGRVPGSFVIGTYDMKIWPKYTLPSLTMHEANPGHHFQLSLLQESEKFPIFRKYQGSFSSLSAAPSSFPTYSSFIEGWGLYAESLGIEMGIFETPLEKYGYYSQDLLRACRLVVDTGIHALDWSREQAITFMEDRLPYDRKFCEGQVDRYITWPGQALSYKIGQLKISKWRKQAEDVLGDKFEIKEFHSLILGTPTNMQSLEHIIQDWISTKNSSDLSNSSNVIPEPHFILSLTLVFLKTVL